MQKAFLSHSSIDKERFVKIVADQLGIHNCIFDETTFEIGMQTLEEIERTLDKTDIFVLFLSNTALESKWVKKELKRANELFKEGNIKRIFPIIIDNKINHEDKRIPKWLKAAYNLRYVSRPTIATRRIKQRLRELSWDFHPRLKERKKIFVGRNNLVNLFEERFDSMDSSIPKCVIASGIEKIGRSSFLKYCLIKTNIVQDYYEPPSIVLDLYSSLEDFIFQVYDLGFSSEIDLTGFMGISIRQKERIAMKLIQDMLDANEVLLIIDNGAIINRLGDISDWFNDILQALYKNNRLIFCITARFRMYRPNTYKRDDVLFLNVPELSHKERIGLLKRYSNFEGISLDNKDISFFSECLTGYPEQVFFTVDLIKDCGLQKAKKDTYLITDFTSERVIHLISIYEKNNQSIEFLYLLSRFDSISYDFIFKIVGETDFYKNLINDFFMRSICDYIGANKEYIRLNDVVREHVKRLDIKINPQFELKIKEHIVSFLNDDSFEVKDVSDFFFTMKEALLQNKEIDDKYLIPSHFLRTMIELYERKKKYNDVVILADKVLEKSDYMDYGIKREILFFLCLSLACLRDERFMIEVHKIDGADHNFLMGFYYRKIGENIKALERLQRALDEKPKYSRVKRELVRVYLNIGDYDLAYEIAKENYLKHKNNPYMAQCYATCLIHSNKNDVNNDLIENILDHIKKINTEQAEELYFTTFAEYLLFRKGNYNKAIEIINESLVKFPNNPYPKLIKFDIYERKCDIAGMKSALEQLDDINAKSFLFMSVLIRKAIYLAFVGKKKNALLLIDQEIKGQPKRSKERLKEKISRIRTNSK